MERGGVAINSLAFYRNNCNLSPNLPPPPSHHMPFVTELLPFFFSCKLYSWSDKGKEKLYHQCWRDMDYFPLMMIQAMDRKKNYAYLDPPCSTFILFKTQITSSDNKQRHVVNAQSWFYIWYPNECWLCTWTYLVIAIDFATSCKCPHYSVRGYCTHLQLSFIMIRDPFKQILFRF